MPFKSPGRVGDSPLPGAGLYAGDLLGQNKSIFNHFFSYANANWQLMMVDICNLSQFYFLLATYGTVVSSKVIANSFYLLSLTSLQAVIPSLYIRQSSHGVSDSPYKLSSRGIIIRQYMYWPAVFAWDIRQSSHGVSQFSRGRSGTR